MAENGHNLQQDHKIRILVAEDDLGIRSSLESYLQLEGFEVHCVGNGEDLIRQIRKDPDYFHLVMVDLTMPVMSGWQFLDLRKTDPVLAQTNVLIMSALGNRVSFDDIPVIQKPFDYKALIRMIRNLTYRYSHQPATEPLPNATL